MPWYNSQDGHGPHSTTLVCICVVRVLLFVLFCCYLCCSMCCSCVNMYCQRVTTQLQLINISYHISQHFASLRFVDKLFTVVLFGNNGNSYTVCMQSDMCIHIHILCTIWRRWSLKRHTNIGTALNAAFQEILPEVPFWVRGP
jgi:hypothetical protein